MSEETRILLVNNLKPEDYMIITDNFRKLDKEIERLKAREQECIDKYLAESKYRSEIEGKYITEKYIIDELEKYCKSEINSTPTFSFDRYYTPGFNDGVKSALNKLKELKEDSNER